MLVNMRIFLILGLFLIEAESYMLLQVRKQNNYSNVDALIHKVVPSDKFDDIAIKLGTKEFSELKKDTKRHAKEIGREIEMKKDVKHKKKDRDFKKENDYATNIEKSILKFVKKDQPFFRSQKEYVKPKIINFRNNKPSVVFEIDSKAIVGTLKELLSSKTFQASMEKLARKAGVVYRTIKEEIDKEYY